jgi:hypothetical protein
MPSLRHLNRLGGDYSNYGFLPRKIFTTLRQVIVSQEGSYVPADSLRILMNTADSSILRYLYGDTRDTQALTEPDQRFAVLISAAHLFLYVALREIPPSNHLTQTLSKRLLAVLGDLDQTAHVWVAHVPALVWVLFVGCMGTVGVAGHDRSCSYEPCLRKILRKFGNAPETSKYKCDDLKRMLVSFLWKDKCCQPALDAIWRDLQER